MRDIALLPRYIGQLADTELKAGVGLLGGLLSFVFGSQSVIIAIIGAGAMILLDTITGFAAAISKGEPITSAKTGRVLVKFLGYSCVLVAAGLVMRLVPGLSGMHEAAIVAVTSLVILTEFVSIVENCQKMGLVVPRFLVGLAKDAKRRIDDGPDAKGQDHGEGEG